MSPSVTVLRVPLLCLAFTICASVPPAARCAENSKSAEVVRAYPLRPIRVIDAYAPGGGTDFLARVIGAALTARFGQPVIIHNRPGAAGNVGADAAAKATPDGYTLLIALTPALATSPSLYGNLPYNVLNDFAYVTLVASGTFVLVVNRSSSVKSLPELIALAKSKPRQLSYSSSGVGGPLHLAGELLKWRA